MVVAQGLRCSVACGIFPDQGWNPHLLHWKVDSLPLSHQGSPEGSLIHIPLGVHPLMRNLLWPAVSSVSSSPHVQRGEGVALASGPSPPLAVMAMLFHSWQAKVFRRWKEPICAMLLPCSYGVAGCQCPQEDMKHPDCQLPS